MEIHRMMFCARMGHLMNLVATASERSPALGGKDVSPTLSEATTEKLPLRRDEVIDAGAGDEKPLEIARDCGSTSGNAFEPSCMRPNLQPSILVRTFSQFTTRLTMLPARLWLFQCLHGSERKRPDHRHIAPVSVSVC